MPVQLQQSSLKSALGLVGAVGVGLMLTTPASAQANSTDGLLIALTPEEQAIINDYKPPKTKTYIPEYNIVELKDVKSFLCTNNSTPDCGFEVPAPSDSIPVPSYGVTDEERIPGTEICRNSNNPLCENSLNYGRLIENNTAEEFQARTRSLWAELDEALAQRRQAPEFTPPPRPATPAPVVAPARPATPAPVPGLW